MFWLLLINYICSYSHSYGSSVLTYFFTELLAHITYRNIFKNTLDIFFGVQSFIVINIRFSIMLGMHCIFLFIPIQNIENFLKSVNFGII